MSNNTTSPILLADPITAIGPLFLGNLINCLLLGTLAMQVYAYWRRYPEDPLFVRALVYGIFAMDFVQTGFGIHESWWYAIENWGNIASLQHGPWTALITPIICGIISALVQIFYAFRIWRLKPQFLPRVSAVLIVLLALLQSLAAIVADSLLGRNLSQANLIRRHPIFMLWLSVSFVTDILIAGSMILILYTAKTKFDTSISRVDSLLNRLILNTIRTGALTVVCAGTTLALFVKYTDKDYYRVFVAILGKLYSNSFMATLNSRAQRDKRDMADSVPLHVHVEPTIQSIRFTPSQTRDTTWELTDVRHLSSLVDGRDKMGVSKTAIPPV